MREIAEDESPRVSGKVVDVEHPFLGRYSTIDMPIKMSDSSVEIKVVSHTR